MYNVQCTVYTVQFSGSFVFWCGVQLKPHVPRLLRNSLGRHRPAVASSLAEVARPTASSSSWVYPAGHACRHRRHYCYDEDRNDLSALALLAPALLLLALPILAILAVYIDHRNDVS